MCARLPWVWLEQKESCGCMDGIPFSSLEVPHVQHYTWVAYRFPLLGDLITPYRTCMHGQKLVWLGWEHPMMTPSPCERLRGKLCVSSGRVQENRVRATVHFLFYFFNTYSSSCHVLIGQFVFPLLQDRFLSFVCSPSCHVFLGQFRLCIFFCCRTDSLVLFLYFYMLASYVASNATQMLDWFKD